LNKIISKSGNFDIIFLIGKIFDISKQFSDIFKLEKIESKFIIFDNSEVSYIVNHKFSDPFYLTPNIILLNRNGIYTIDNIKIAYFSGLENEKYLSLTKNALNYSQGQDLNDIIYSREYFKREDVEKIIRIKEDNEKDALIDILISHSAPSIILQDLLNSTNSPLFLSLENKSDNNLIEKNDNNNNNNPFLNLNRIEMEKLSSYSCNLISKKIRPRYHITSLDDFFYEKLPYSNYDLNHENEKEEIKTVTRFINIAYVYLNNLKILN
jgi:hypothetical protein